MSVIVLGFVFAVSFLLFAGLGGIALARRRLAARGASGSGSVGADGSSFFLYTGSDASSCGSSDGGGGCDGGGGGD